MSDLRAILFDMDGLLIDTEELHMRAIAETAAGLGFVRDPMDYRVWIGRSAHELSGWLVEQITVDITRERLLETEQEIFLRILGAERPPPLPGAREMIEACEDLGLSRGLVSSTAYAQVVKTMEVVLEHLERPGSLEQHFASVTTGDRVPKPKPAPDPYLIGASDLGVTPGECLVFEDSPSGARSARAAGCKVVAIPNPYLDEDECIEHAHAHFPTLADAYAARVWESL